jgi:hypothetical protein
MHRRRFLTAVAATAATTVASLAVPRLLAARSGECAMPKRLGNDPTKHPDPRPGITADSVLPDDQVAEKAKNAYAAAREHPAILDGLYCHCDCAERDGLRSLLSCFETHMPESCSVCRGEAEMAGRLIGDGKSLDDIRAAIDRKYG